MRTTRLDYRASKINFKLVQAQSLDEVTAWFDAAQSQEELDSIRERASARSISEQARSRGTVQSSAWRFTQPTEKMRAHRWFVVVTRNDPPWGAALCSQQEPYALVAVLDDRLDQQMRTTSELYTQVQSRLRARVRPRARR